MFELPRKFSFYISSRSKMIISTIPINGELHVFVGVQRKQLNKRDRITATVFKINKELTHTGIIETPYTKIEENDKSSELDLATYKLFKQSVMRTLIDLTSRLKNPNKVERVNQLLDIIARGMRHPAETSAKKLGLKIVK